jgi:hypothetical protein
VGNRHLLKLGSQGLGLTGAFPVVWFPAIGIRRLRAPQFFAILPPPVLLTFSLLSLADAAHGIDCDRSANSSGEDRGGKQGLNDSPARREVPGAKREGVFRWHAEATAGVYAFMEYQATPR